MVLFEFGTLKNKEEEAVPESINCVKSQITGGGRLPTCLEWYY